MRCHADLVHVGLTAVVVAVVVLIDAATGGWATVGWRPLMAIVLVSGLVWVGRRHGSPNGLQSPILAWYSTGFRVQR